MGYTTTFTGQFTITPPLEMSQFAELKTLGDGTREEGPGGYMQWEPTDDGTALKWDENEKFYDYVEWLQWLIDERFTPWNRTLSGEVKWRGESRGDAGTLSVVRRKVVAKKSDEMVTVTIEKALVEAWAEDQDGAGDLADAVVDAARSAGAL